MLETLVHLIGHELMHYVNTSVCGRNPAKDGHDKTFLSLNNYFNAHPYGKYRYSIIKGHKK